MNTDATGTHIPQRGGIRGEAERFAGLLDEHGMTVVTVHPAWGHDFDIWKSAVHTAIGFLVSGWATTP